MTGLTPSHQAFHEKTAGTASIEGACGHFTLAKDRTGGTIGNQAGGVLYDYVRIRIAYFLVLRRSETLARGLGRLVPGPKRE